MCSSNRNRCFIKVRGCFNQRGRRRVRAKVKQPTTRERLITKVSEIARWNASDGRCQAVNPTGFYGVPRLLKVFSQVC
jgi:hypothetical protein